MNTMQLFLQFITIFTIIYVLIEVFPSCNSSVKTADLTLLQPLLFSVRPPNVTAWGADPAVLSLSAKFESHCEGCVPSTSSLFDLNPFTSANLEMDEVSLSVCLSLSLSLSFSAVLHLLLQMYGKKNICCSRPYL